MLKLYLEFIIHILKVDMKPNYDEFELFLLS